MLMGIDLKILASNFRERDGRMLSTASIRLDRDPRVLSLIAKDDAPIPPELSIGHFEDEGLRYDRTDSRGNPLTFTTPEKLQQSQKILESIEETSQWNRAAVAYLLSLPPGSRIVLYWC
jgi:hypothetical protein